MAQRYALRVDEVDDSVRPALVSFLGSALVLCYLCTRETVAGENPHFHVYLESDAVIATLRQNLRRRIPALVGNQHYSLKKCQEDVSGYWRYLCKGESEELQPHVICAQGLEFSAENISLLHEAFWVNRAEIDAARHARKKIKGATITEKVLEICRHRGIRYSQATAIAEVYINLCLEGNKGISTFAAKSVVRTVMCKLCPDGSAVSDLACDIVQGIVRSD